MKTPKRKTLLIPFIAWLVVQPAISSAIIFTDSTGDIFDGGLTNLDISQVTVSHDATHIHFQVETVGTTDNWTKFNILINTGSGTSTTNGWNRPHTNAAGADFFIGGWVDATPVGAQLYQFSSGSWNQIDDAASATPDHIGVTAANFGNVTYSVTLASLGNPTSISFDVGTTGGGADPWVDALSLSTQSTSGWSTASTGGQLLTYAVPEPSLLGLVAGVGVLAAVWLRRGRFRAKA